GPLIASALLYSALQQSEVASYGLSPLPSSWLIEQPARLSNPKSPSFSLGALVLSRYSLVNLSTFCSAILLFHVLASWWFEALYRRTVNAPTSERCSVPRSEIRRTWYYVFFMVAVSAGALVVRALSVEAGLGVW